MDGPILFEYATFERHREIFESGKKKLQILKCPDTCEKGLSLESKKNEVTYKIWSPSPAFSLLAFVS